MIDPILSLAFSIHSKPGIYALLLGSGVSRSASIPTGYEVVLDLIKRLAIMMEEDCEPNPAAWYKNKYKEEPDYSKLIDTIAKSPAERSQLLRGYFEPNEEERDQGLKTPTDAHKSIANLVANDFIKVIITTNFDRLLEKALEVLNVVPTVISTPDAVEGALPLTHTDCTIIKLHGDYIDTRIKNTPSELENYDDRVNHLLDRIFDEFGLIVCGWSAEWDAALRTALERCQSHRFTTYWAARSEPKEVTKKLIKLRRAEVIKIEDADKFFKEVKQKVLALQDLEKPHPLSPKVAVENLKRYISEERFRIQLHDLMFNEANKLYEKFSEDEFSINTAFNLDVFKNRILKYESLTEILQNLIIAGCYFGEKIHEKIWIECLERVNVTKEEKPGIDVWENLQFYPSLILLYAGGISSIIANKYQNLAALLTMPKYLKFGKEIQLIFRLIPNKVIHNDSAKIVFNLGNHPTPTSKHLEKLLMNYFNDFSPDESRFIKFFDRFEYLFTLVYADLSERQKGRIWAPVGCFLWRNRDEPEKYIINEIKDESDKQGDNWPPIKAGLFDGSFERFQRIQDEFDQWYRKIPWF